MSLRHALLAAAMLAGAAGPAIATQQPDKIFVFGDSLVDAGNISFLTNGAYDPPSKGYFPGRFTNGPDYTDLLSQRLYGSLSKPSLRGGTNYAFGGARIVNDGDAIPDLALQVGGYLAAAGHVADPNALYIINDGGNDVYGIEAGNIGGYANVTDYTNALLDTLAGSIATLSATGATHILVTGIPNDDATAFALDALVQARLDAIEPSLTGTTLERFSYNSFFTQLQADPQKFGVAPFTHLPTDGCFNHLSPPATQDCSGYFSVDGIHPIAPIQAAIFREVAHITGIGTVPEPASWALMIVGFGLVGTALRRRPATSTMAAA
ncbi:SGNH/GDSL hydrolase family protein [Polymorphobacter sp. PAMC 29334]|uniref:SGNH/GDSL hydrolase family protein n=1 Tax=Polymorphobacter sp. PAMC 29334 TaxID=2862331 RepID=UPI001D0080D6|nr:SGNH/GDSL hydrolase family protein [Polymorphobacter sp. PAMC 29334]